jgi:hypothetical protein
VSCRPPFTSIPKDGKPLTGRGIDAEDPTASRVGKTVAPPADMSRAPSTSESGFSLAETLVALALLAGALLSLARIFVTATTVVTTSRHVTMGSILASQKLEELRAVVSSLPPASDARDGIEFVDRDGVAAPAHGNVRHVTYTRRWRIRPLPSDPDHVSVIQVVVTPGAVRGGRSESVPHRPDEVVLVTMQARDRP